jgi:hypothetical protein
MSAILRGKYQHCEVAKKSAGKRASRKIYCDINCLCNYIEKKEREADANIDDWSLENVRKAFGAAEKELHGGSGKRKDQLKWRTLVIKVRKKLQISGAGWWSIV